MAGPDIPTAVSVMESPQQTPITPYQTVNHQAFRIILKANFDIEARVLATERYWLGESAELVPVDLALGWKKMSRTEVLKDIAISQYGRWYIWKVKGPLPVSRKDIEQNSANMHIIPATSGVRDVLLSLKKDQLVHISGFLVNAVDPSGNVIFNSSLTRSDTGAGACEVIYAESIEIKGEFKG